MTKAMDNNFVDENCIFCQISNNLTNNSQLLYEDNNLVIINDIKPAVDQHYLVLPKKHITNIKNMKKEESIQIINNMKTIGENFMKSKGFTDESQLRMGYHWPPFNSISHIHLHLLYPIRQMSWISRVIFKTGSFWFVEINDLIQWLSKR
ncbi:adenosine 5'-monophosphoramidase HINT3-like [Oppia nitens]|uniref:adenosine 5'-monophosphoramidase HINT3-like n=1 Tax=Oppia nitens TaxID=1686743 RepID=UPI0023D9DDD9|nr:adenosine 5'-monophosphoramidase HINT3-like [Oppia nitens]